MNAPVPSRAVAGVVIPPVPLGEELALDDNTNLFGVPPRTAREMLGAAPLLARYPEMGSPALREALADYAGVGADEVVVGCGSDDVLAAAFRALAEPGARVAYTSPTFSLVPDMVRAARLEPVAASFAAGFDLDVDALLGIRAPLLYVCAPNNPTGTMPSPEALRRLLAEVSGRVILDEAYVEFAAGGLAPNVPARENVVVVRTLSKAFGLAGLRVGYAVGTPDAVRRIAGALGPYRVGTIAARAAVAALRGDRTWVRERVAEACEVRERLAGALRTLGLAPLPSAGNFVLVPVRDAAATATALERRGVRVRAFAGLDGIRDAVRVTVAPAAMLERLLSAFAEVPT